MHVCVRVQRLDRAAADFPCLCSSPTHSATHTHTHTYTYIHPYSHTLHLICNMSDCSLPTIRNESLDASLVDLSHSDDTTHAAATAADTHDDNTHIQHTAADAVSIVDSLLTAPATTSFVTPPSSPRSAVVVTHRRLSRGRNVASRCNFISVR